MRQTLMAFFDVARAVGGAVVTLGQTAKVLNKMGVRSRSANLVHEHERGANIAESQEDHGSLYPRRSLIGVPSKVPVGNPLFQNQRRYLRYLPSEARLAILLLFATFQTAHAQSYTLHVLPKLPSEVISNDVAYAVNDAGLIVGNSNSNDTEWFGFVYDTATGAYQLVGTYFDAFFGGSSAWCLNNQNVVGGGAARPQGAGCYIAITAQISLPLQSTPLPPTPLSWLPSGGTAVVYGINDNGISVGYSNRAPVCSYAFGNPPDNSNPCVATKWSNGAATAIPTLGGVASTATAINISGSIVGFDVFAGSNLSDFANTRAFVLPSGSSSPIPLATLGGSSSRAFAISNAGTIVGFSQDSMGRYRAARWSDPNSVVALGSLPGFSHSAAFQITQDGVFAVGTATQGLSSASDFYFIASNVLVYGNRAVVFIADQVLDLNTLIAPAPGVNLRNAFGVNSSRWIVGNCDFNSERRGFLLTPCAPLILHSPSSISSCVSGSGQFAVTTSGPPASSYQWQIQTSPPPNEVWQTLASEPCTIPCSSGGTGTAFATPANSPSVSISVRGCEKALGYRWPIRCIVSNACGSATSNAATLTICAADLNCDGFLDFTDFDGFVTAFELGDPTSDFNADGFLDFTDFDGFVSAFEVGC